MAQPSPEDQYRAYLAALIALYVNAEESLLGGVAGILRLTKPVPFEQVMALSKMRALAQSITRQLTAGTRKYVPPMVQAAIEAGEMSGSKEIARVSTDVVRGGGQPPTGTDLVRTPGPFDFSIPKGERAAQAVKDDLNSSLLDVTRRITRLPDDVYKIISPAAAAGQVLGHGYTPAQAQAYAWREFVRRGVTGFTDRSGREWSLSAYVEMSVRTATMRAFNDAHLQVIQATGENLVTVHDDGHPCPLCFPWQNVIMCIIPDGVHPSIAEAIAAGLMHPNCRHHFSVVHLGVTRLPEPREWTDEDARLYNLTQKQRRLELEERKAKQTLEYAIDPDAARQARRDVRQAQRRIREFIDQTGFLRQPRREQVDLANDHLKLPTLR